jgi:hypothetical protein
MLVALPVSARVAYLAAVGEQGDLDGRTAQRRKIMLDVAAVEPAEDRPEGVGDEVGVAAENPGRLSQLDLEQRLLLRVHVHIGRVHERRAGSRHHQLGGDVEPLAADCLSE